jgi:hypothetical protein
MSFGRHKGQQVCHVPSDYLAWVLHECCNINPWLRQAIIGELARRRAGARADSPPRPAADPNAPPAVPAEVIRRWYGLMIRRYHPDTGGTTESAQVINDAHDALRAMLGL